MYTASGVEYTPTANELNGVAALARVVRTQKWSVRDDLVIKLADAPKLPDAWMTPGTAEITINLKPFRPAIIQLARETVTPNGSLSTYDGDKYELIRKLYGVAIHETGHADISRHFGTPSYEALSPEERDVLTTLEELRVEAHQVKRSRSRRRESGYEDNARPLLRAASTLVLPDKDEITKVLSTFYGEDGATFVRPEGFSALRFSTYVALILGRGAVGTLNEHEYGELWDLADDVFGPDLMDELMELWYSYIDIKEEDEFSDEAKAEIAIEWVQLLKDDFEDDSIDLPGLIGMIVDAIGEIADKVSDTPMHGEEAKRYVDEMATEDEQGVVTAFEKTLPGRWTRRRPDARLRRNAQLLARRLEKLSVSNVSATKKASAVPPGKLSTRAAMQNDALIARGQYPTVKPWKRTARAHSTHPKLVVGIATDISGSMGWAEEFVAEASWIVARAIHHVNGEVAAIAFGSGVYPTVQPGVVPEEVVIVPAVEGVERFNESVAALDKKLRLSDPKNGVRLLFVISDGQFVSEGEPETRTKWGKRLGDAGCAIVWIHRSALSEYYRPKEATMAVVSGVALSEPHKIFADAIEKAIRDRKVARG